MLTGFGHVDRSRVDQVQASYGKLPLAFERNEGRAPREAQFVARARGLGVMLTPNGAYLALNKEPRSAALQLHLLDATSQSKLEGEEELAGKINYFIGNDPAQWRTDIRTFAKIRQKAVYHGVDLVYHGDNGRLEYDFVVAPGANPNSIALQLAGADSLEISATGELLIHIGPDELRQPKPVAYQETKTGRKVVEVSYALHGKDQIGFTVGPYHTRAALVIDPVLVYSTYLGGNGDDAANGIAVDKSGSAYIAGYTASTNFPTAMPIQTSSGLTFDSGHRHAFVSKLSPDGSSLVYSTYLGGNVDDVAYGIALDGQNNVYVTGATYSTNFPVQNALQGLYKFSGNGGQCHTNAFITKINAAGNGLVYSSYLGGSGDGSNGDQANAIAVDSSNAAYLAGYTYSSDFPTKSAVQSALTGTFFFKTTDGGANWISTEGNLPKRTIVTVTVDPKTPSTVYLTLIDGGVFKSTDSGATWNESDSGLPLDGDVGLIAVDPSNSSVVYAAGGRGETVAASGCLVTDGVYKSTDGGAHWARSSNGLTDTTIQHFVIDPKTSSTLYVATNTSVFKSSDAATNWAALQLPVANINVIVSLVIDPVNTSTLYAGVATNDIGTSGIFKSGDGGATWSRITPPAVDDIPLLLAIDPTHPATIYAASQQLFKSTDGGGTWTQLGAIPNKAGTDNIASILVDPVTPSTLYVTAFDAIAKSTDGGSTWNAVTLPGLKVPQRPVLALNASSPSTLFAALIRQPDAFVAKIDPAGASLSYSTFLGGNDSDKANGIAVDSTGAYLVGTTRSINFPTQSAFQPSDGGGGLCYISSCSDAFVTKISPTGSALLYSSYVGGSANETGDAIAIDPSGNAYLAGSTASDNFPVLNAVQATHTTIAGLTNAFVSKLNAAGSALVYSTYLGGSVQDEALGIAVDLTGAVTVVGDTESPDFPLLHPLQCAGGSRAIISRLNADGKTLSYSTTFGGASTDFSSFDVARGVALDLAGNAYLAGGTSSSDFPTLNPIQSSLATCATAFCSDAFVSKIDLQGATGADTAIVKCADNNAVNARRHLTYTLHVTNNGPQLATGVTVTDTLPATVSLVSATSTVGSCSGSSTVTCNLGDINAGDGAVITLAVRPNSAGTITNTANVTTSASDANSRNNSSLATTQVLESPTQLLNISTRMEVLTGSNVLIGGFILVGSEPKKILARGLGPSLPVSGPLADPTLELHDSQNTLAANDNWQDTQAADIQATGIPPTNSLESAILTTLPVSGGFTGYTAVLAGKNQGTGIGLVEIYDLDQPANSTLANISTRGFVDTGDNIMIGGLILGPGSGGAVTVLIRGIGPSLAAAGVANTLQDPTLELHDGNGGTIATNDNWKDTQQADIQATGVAPGDDRESAILHTLTPGNYTAIVRGKENTTGVALVELYNLE